MTGNCFLGKDLMSISLQQLVINQAKINQSRLLWSYISSALFLFCLSYIHALKLNYKGNQKASSTETLSLAHRFFFHMQISLEKN